MIWRVCICMKKSVLVVMIGLMSSSLLAGGGWTPKKGEGFFMLSHRIIAGSYLANSDAMFGISPFAMIQTTNIYAEFGILNRLGGIVYSPILTIGSQDAGVDEFGKVYLEDAAAGLGDIDLALKYQLLDNKVKLSGSVWFGINSGDYYAGENQQIHLGDGEFNQMARLDLSSSFKSFWWNVYGGFNNRTNNFSDEIKVGGEFGWKKKRLSALMKIDTKYSLFNGSQADSYTPSIYSNNQEYFAINPQILYEFDNHIGLMAEAGFALSSRNIIAAPSLSVGVFYNLKKK